MPNTSRVVAADGSKSGLAGSATICPVPSLTCGAVADLNFTRLVVLADGAVRIPIGTCP